MPGSYSDPVICNPFFRIESVHWRVRKVYDIEIYIPDGLYATGGQEPDGGGPWFEVASINYTWATESPALQHTLSTQTFLNGSPVGGGLESIYFPDQAPGFPGLIDTWDHVPYLDHDAVLAHGGDLAATFSVSGGVAQIATFTWGSDSVLYAGHSIDYSGVAMPSIGDGNVVFNRIDTIVPGDPTTGLAPNVVSYRVVLRGTLTV